MTERRIYLTEEDIPDLDTPCYVTDKGEVYQFSRRENRIVQRTMYLDKRTNYLRVSISLKKGSKNNTTSLCLAPIVYRCFSGEENLPKKMHLNHRDNNPANCCIDNLYRTDKINRNKVFKKRQLTTCKQLRKLGIQPCDEKLTLSDLNSIICFLSMKKEHSRNYLAKTYLVIDTNGWSENDLNRLKKMKLDDEVEII